MNILNNTPTIRNYFRGEARGMADKTSLLAVDMVEDLLLVWVYGGDEQECHYDTLSYKLLCMYVKLILGKTYK